MAASSGSPRTSRSPDRDRVPPLAPSFAAALVAALTGACSGRSAPPPTTVLELPDPSTASTPLSDSSAPYPVRELGAFVYAVPGDSGRGVEGRANAGFVVTDEGVVAIDALGSPRQGERLLAAIRGVTPRPVRWLVLTHHHPDHQFGAVALRRAGARVVAHPDDTMQAAGESDSALVADWTRVVGEEEMRGFAFANEPDLVVSRDTTLVVGGQEMVISHPGTAHSPGDLTVWLPGQGVLFAGDLLVEDGVTMVNDGDSRVLLDALEGLRRLRPGVVVPGHGAIPADPEASLVRTEAYVEELRAEMRRAFDEGVSLNEVVAALPAGRADSPVSRASRERRNAVRVYLEIEREAMGMAEPASPEGGGAR